MNRANELKTVSVVIVNMSTNSVAFRQKACPEAGVGCGVRGGSA